MARKGILFILSIGLFSGCQSTGFSPQQTPQAAYYNVQLGLGYLQQGNFPRAKQKLLLAKQQAPKSAVVYGALAYYYELIQQQEQAERYYQQAVMFGPGEAAHLNNYAAFLCRQQRYSLADVYFNRALADDHYLDLAAIYESAAKCAQAAGEESQADFYSKRAQEHQLLLL